MTRPLGVVGFSKYFGIVSLTIASADRRAGGGVDDLADDHPGAWPRRSVGGRDDLRGTPTRQGEHDNERGDPGCLSEPDHCGSGYY